MADTVRVGILLPTREAVMSGKHEIAPLLTMAEEAEASGYHSVWVGDSILARPRFEPLTSSLLPPPGPNAWPSARRCSSPRFATP